MNEYMNACGPRRLLAFMQLPFLGGIKSAVCSLYGLNSNCTNEAAAAAAATAAAFKVVRHQAGIQGAGFAQNTLHPPTNISKYMYVCLHSSCLPPHKALQITNGCRMW